MSLLANMGFMPMTQEFINRETLELIAQQSTTTQLVIILVLVLAIGGTIAFFTLRGGIKVFQQLSDNIRSQSEIEATRLKQHEKIADALERQTEVFDNFFSGYETRVKNVDEMVKVIYDNVYYIKENVVHLNEIISQNPQDYRTLLQLLQNLNETSTRAKYKTEEIEKVITNE